MLVRRRLFAVLAIHCVFLVACSSAFGSSACPGDDVEPSADSIQQSELALLCDMNAVRAQNGLAPLRWDWRLWHSAQTITDAMAANHFFSHVDPQGHDLIDRISPTGYLAGAGDPFVLENLGWGGGSLGTPSAITTGWMNSDGHRVNVLDKDVTDVGIGVAWGSPSDGSEDGLFYAADFGRPATPARPVRPAIAPRRGRCAFRRLRSARQSARTRSRPIAYAPCGLRGRSTLIR